MTTVTTDAACPIWCASTHADDQLLGYVLHEGTATVVETGDAVPGGLADAVRVQLKSLVSQTPGEDFPCSIGLTFVTYGDLSDTYIVSARETLRLAKVLVQHATAVLAQENAESPVVTR